MLFNDLLPADYPFVNEQMPKKRQATIINDLAERYPMIVVAQTVDKLKDAGFYWATRSGVTLSISDVVVPDNKGDILDGYEQRADQVEKRYRRGALSHQERNDELVKVWTSAREEVADAMGLSPNRIDKLRQAAEEDLLAADASLRVIEQLRQATQPPVEDLHGPLSDTTDE